MRIFGWAADSAGCGFYRMGLPLAELGKHGHDTQVSISRTGFESTADVIVGQRVCNDGPTSWWQALGALPTGQRPKMVYELDDDLWGIHPQNDMAAGYFAAPTGRLVNISNNIAVSDLVTVSTDYLGRVVSERMNESHGFCPPIKVLPNCVPEALFTLPRPFRQEPILGYAGSGTHRPDFREAGPEIERFLRRNPEVVWHTMGGDFLGPNIPKRTHTGWMDSVGAYYSQVDFTVGVAPLIHHPFNYSKSPIKALEYGAMGIPIVASDVGPYSDFVVHGETGYLVKRDHEWGGYLRHLFTDPAARTIMAEKARRRAQTYMIESFWQAWERAYEGVGDAR